MNHYFLRAYNLLRYFWPPKLIRYKYVEIIFAQHDISLAQIFKKMLVDGTDLNINQIRLVTESSFLDGKLENNDLVIPVMLITCAFYESPHCMRLLGEYVARCKEDVYPIVFGPVDYQDLRGMLLGVQVDNANQDNAYSNLADRLSSKIGCDVSMANWSNAQKNFIVDYEKLKNDIGDWRLRDRFPYDPWSNVHNELRDLIAAKRCGGTWGFKPYFCKVNMKNQTGYIVIDVCKTGTLSFYPNTIVQNHLNVISGTQMRNHTTPPIGLITLMVPKPGHRKSPKPECDSKDVIQFYRYIDWWSADCREQLLKALDEAELL